MERSFGELVRSKRELLGLSMRELARRTSVDVAYISKVEKGQATMPSFSVVMRLAKELNFNMQTLQRIFNLDEDIESVIASSVKNQVQQTEREAIQGILEDIVGITNNPDFDIVGAGELLQKVYAFQQQKHNRKDVYYLITIEEKEWIHVLQTPVVDSQLLTLYHQAMELKEDSTFIIKGTILSFPDYFNESQVIDLQGLLDKCNKIVEEDDMYIEFTELRKYLEELLNKL